MKNYRDVIEKNIRELEDMKKECLEEISKLNHFDEDGKESIDKIKIINNYIIMLNSIIEEAEN